MLASFRAEMLKLRKRPGVWILLATMFSVVLLLGYVLFYLLVTQLPSEELQGLDTAAVLAAMRPDQLSVQVLTMTLSFGGALGIILGALAVGAEYGWRTVKTMATQGPRRRSLITGRALAILVFCLFLAVAAFGGGIAGTALVSLFEQGDAGLPVAADVLEAFGAVALIIGVWCAIGVLLATLFRSTAWAIGIGLVYALAVESVLGILPLPGGLGDLMREALIGSNTAALVLAAAPETAATLGSSSPQIAASQAIAVLLGYLLGALVIASAVFARRDIAT